jgi:hypothetical protein
VAYRAGRAKAYEGIDFEEVRNQIAAIKSSASSHFDELAEQFLAPPRPVAPKFSAPAIPRR